MKMQKKKRLRDMSLEELQKRLNRLEKARNESPKHLVSRKEKYIKYQIKRKKVIK